MVSISWTFVCLIIVDLLWQRVTGSGEDERVIGSLTWNGTLPRRHSSGSGGGNSTGFCMDWSKNFSTPHDVLLRLNAKLDHNLSLQIFKYTDTTASELVGELKGCGDSQQYEIALANCTRFVLKFVANPCLQNVNRAQLFYYAVRSLPDLNSGFCHHSPCTTNVPCQHLQIPDSMGYRCYCKNWLPENCTPGLMNSSDPSSCKCPGVNYVGEICNLIVPATTIATTGGQTQSASSSPSRMAVAGNPSFQGTVATNASTGSGSTSAVEIGAGVAGGIAVIVLLLVTFVICHRLFQSKASEHICCSTADTTVVHLQSTEELEVNVAYASTGQREVNNVQPPTELETNICYATNRRT